MPEPTGRTGRSGRTQQRREEPKGPLEQLVDLAVFAPIGFFMSLDELVPQLVEKGHQHVQVARFFGRTVEEIFHVD